MPTAAQTPPSRPPQGLLEEITVTQSYTLGRPGHFRFTGDAKTLLFLRAQDGQPRMDLWAKDTQTGEERVLVSAQALLAGSTEQLSAQEKALRERKRIKTRGFSSFTLSQDGRRVVLKLSGKVYLHTLKTGQTVQLPLPEGVVMDPRLSPNAKRLAFVLNHNLHVVRLRPGKGTVSKTRALTEDGGPDHSHGIAEFVAAEEMSRYRGYWWSPDSRRLAYQTTDERALERFTIADAAQPESAAQVFAYPRPGKANAQVRLHIVGTDGSNRTEVKWDRERYPYLARVTWPKAGPLSILVQARDQQSQVLLTVDERTGRTQTLLKEQDPAWLNLSNSTPKWIKGAKSLLWATEKSGAWNLVRYRVRAGAGGPTLGAAKTLLNDDAGFRSLVHVDSSSKTLWFLGGPDPVESHLYRVKLSGGTPERITTEPGEHHAHFSSDGTQFVLTRTTMQRPARSTLHRVADLKGRVPPLASEVSDFEVLSRARKAALVPNVQRVPPEKAGGFHAAIIRPKGFSADKRYPVVLYVYGGPHHNTVVANASRYYLHQWMADHGFIVVCIDGRGTMHRGREFERAIREKFAEVPLADQIKGLTALGHNYPELDMDRVGVYGWSFGGYLSALAALRRPDVFKVAVAGAPVTEWLYYDTHYTERYLGLPQTSPEAYRSSSLLTYAKDLKRPLLLVHGIADDNVYFAHTLKLAEALFVNKKDFDLLPLVGATHQVSDPKVRSALYDRMVGFLGAELW